MPSLKDLTCTIELSQAHQPLPEYNTIYGDGIVETCVPIPMQLQSFSIHLTSTKFIAPGIALFVYIDSVYQCNRNRQGLKPSMPSGRHSLVDFRVRQKEERRRDGSMVAREWTFDTLSNVSADESCASNTLENKDCIEVVVLRCAGSRDPKTVPPPMNLDGAGDWSDCYLDSDAGSSRDYKWSGYDDRDPELNRVDKKFGSLPPPPVSHRAPYAETLRSGEDLEYKIHYARNKASRGSASHHSKHESRYSGTISPRTRRADDLPPEGFQYGSGPIPSAKEGPHRRKDSNTGLESNGVDQVWLNKLLKNAVKQGVEESRRVEAKSEKHDRDSIHMSQKEDLTSQAPGAWPGSPISEFKGKLSMSKRASSHKSNRQSDVGSHWRQSQGGWAQHETKSKAGTRVNWDVEPAWETETSSSGNDWHSNGETPSESWDTDETWETKGEEWKDPSVTAKLCPSTSPPQFDAQHLIHPRSSKLGYPTHSEDKPWADHAPSSSPASLSSSNDTIQPSHYQSHSQTSRPKPKSSARPSKSPHGHHARDSSRHTHHTSSWHSSVASKPSVPSSITHITPVIVNAPVTPVPNHPRPTKSNTHSDTRASLLPVPAWVAAVQDILKTQPSDTLPAPYAEAWGKEIKDAALAWNEGGKDAASAWDASGKSSPSISSEKKPRSKTLSTWSTVKKPLSSPSNTPLIPYTASAWDEGKKDTGSSWDGSQRGTPSPWDESVKNGPAVSEKKLRSTSSSTWGTNKDSTSDTSKDSTWDADTTWSSTPKPSHKTEWTAEPSSPTPVPWDTTPSSKKHRSKKAKKADHASKSSAEKALSPKSSPKQPKQDTCKNIPVPPFTQSWTFPPASSPPPPSAPQPPSLAPPPRSQTSHASTVKTTVKTTVKKSPQPAAIRTTEPTDYGHAVARPEYLDSLERPYAVFRFKCRRGEELTT